MLMLEKASWKGRLSPARGDAGCELPVGPGGREREPERDEHRCDRREKDLRLRIREEIVMGTHKEGDVVGDRE